MLKHLSNLSTSTSLTIIRFSKAAIIKWCKNHSFRVMNNNGNNRNHYVCVIFCQVIHCNNFSISIYLNSFLFLYSYTSKFLLIVLLPYWCSNTYSADSYPFTSKLFLEESRSSFIKFIAHQIFVFFPLKTYLLHLSEQYRQSINLIQFENCLCLLE